MGTVIGRMLIFIGTVSTVYVVSQLVFDAVEAIKDRLEVRRNG